MPHHEAQQPPSSEAPTPFKRKTDDCRFQESTNGVSLLRAMARRAVDLLRTSVPSRTAVVGFKNRGPISRTLDLPCFPGPKRSSLLIVQILPFQRENRIFVVLVKRGTETAVGVSLILVTGGS